jgi:hypothetical protein
MDVFMVFLALLFGIGSFLFGLWCIHDEMKARKLADHFQAGWNRCYAAYLELEGKFDELKAAVDADGEENYQMYSEEYDEHEGTKEDLRAAQELLAESDRANKQLHSVIEHKNKYIAKQARAIERRDEVLRANYHNITDLAGYETVTE